MTTKTQSEYISELEADILDARVIVGTLAAMVQKMGEVVLTFPLPDSERAWIEQGMRLAQPFAHDDGQLLRLAKLVERRVRPTAPNSN